jgi:hypothetical protein
MTTNRDELFVLYSRIEDLEAELKSSKQNYRVLEISLSFEKRSLLVALSKLKLCRERLGPAGYKVLQRLMLAERVCELLNPDDFILSEQEIYNKWKNFK